MKDPTEFDDETFDTLFRPEQKRSKLRAAYEAALNKAKRNEQLPYQIFWGILIACIAIPIVGSAALSMVASEGLLKTHIFWFIACFVVFPLFGGATNNDLTAKDLFQWSAILFGATTAAGWLGSAAIIYIILPLME